MSNAIRYDALLLRALAAELQQTLRGARVARAWFDRTARVLALELGEKRDPRTLSWNLHPTAGQVALRPGIVPHPGSLLQVRRGDRIASVHSLPDERVLRIDLETPGDAAAGLVRSLIVEFIGNRWNACALALDERIADVLLPRTTGPRDLRAGIPYPTPAPSSRGFVHELPSLDDWLAALADGSPTDRTRALLAGFAWSSPLNARYILAEAAEHEVGEHVLAEAHARYLELRTSPPRPHLLDGVQPYIHPLLAQATSTPTLLAAFESATAGAALPALGEEALRALLEARLHERAQRILARCDRLRHEADTGRNDAAALRTRGDILLARLQQVPRGESVVELEGFEGEPVRIELDPALSPRQNADALYERARRQTRAAARVPALLERAERELASVHALRTRLQHGDIADDELRELAVRAEKPQRAASLPYREYRTSGGLEVRVGRNSRANDALTREHAASDDIWLHARDVGGAHVILRWGRKDANPPRADLVEAAVLAALYSRARTSGTVPVDWTRRKYVRKPRKAPPGLVLPERVSTLFVEPDSAVEERLRVEEDA